MGPGTSPLAEQPLGMVLLTLAQSGRCTDPSHEWQRLPCHPDSLSTEVLCEILHMSQDSGLESGVEATGRAERAGREDEGLAFLPEEQKHRSELELGMYIKKHFSPFLPYRAGWGSPDLKGLMEILAGQGP